MLLRESQKFGLRKGKNIPAERHVFFDPIEVP
jgi:hypothetical protein